MERRIASRHVVSDPPCPRRSMCSVAVCADRGHVHLCTKGHSRCHVGDHDLHCLELRVVPRGGKASVLGRLRREGPHIKREAQETGARTCQTN